MPAKGCSSEIWPSSSNLGHITASRLLCFPNRSCMIYTAWLFNLCALLSRTTELIFKYQSNILQFLLCIWDWGRLCGGRRKQGGEWITVGLTRSPALSRVGTLISKVCLPRCPKQWTGWLEVMKTLLQTSYRSGMWLSPTTCSFRTSLGLRDQITLWGRLLFVNPFSVHIPKWPACPARTMSGSGRVPPCALQSRTGDPAAGASPPPLHTRLPLPG